MGLHFNAYLVLFQDFIHHKLDESTNSFSSSISTANYLHTMQVREDSLLCDHSKTT